MPNYMCPMHPDATSDRPMNCPKCGMKMERRDDNPEKAPTKNNPPRER